MRCLGEPSNSMQNGEQSGILESAQLASSSAKTRSSTEEKKRRVVIVGIPGVGKSTVVTRVVGIIREKGHTVELVNYGTTMMEEATRRHGLKSRDDMRKTSSRTSEVPPGLCCREIFRTRKPIRDYRHPSLHRD